MARSKRIGVLWLREKKMDDGSTLRYFSGYIDTGLHGDIPVAIFRARDKPNENSPDYHIVLSDRTGADVPEPPGEDVPV